MKCARKTAGRRCNWNAWRPARSNSRRLSLTCSPYKIRRTCGLWLLLRKPHALPARMLPTTPAAVEVEGWEEKLTAARSRETEKVRSWYMRRHCSRCSRSTRRCSSSRDADHRSSSRSPACMIYSRKTAASWSSAGRASPASSSSPHSLQT